VGLRAADWIGAVATVHAGVTPVPLVVLDQIVLHVLHELVIQVVAAAGTLVTLPPLHVAERILVSIVDHLIHVTSFRRLNEFAPTDTHFQNAGAQIELQ
jgi:hypothetical protein